MLTQPFSPSAALLEFHRTFKVAVRTVPVATPPEASTRKILLAEEVQEFADAVADDDLVEIADALGDISYIAWGCGTVHGIDLDTAFAAVHSPTGDPDEYARAYFDAMEAGDIAAVTISLACLLRRCADLATSYGFDIVDVLQEIHRSNMTKLDENGRAIVRPDGKIVKGPNFEPPNLAAIVGVRINAVP